MNDGKYSSKDFNGQYTNTCPLVGDEFNSCGYYSNDHSPDDDNVGFGKDTPYTFVGETGKVVWLPDSTNPTYGVSFNDNRTSYSFPEHHVSLVQTDSNYEFWFVQRNRFEKILLKRKGFKVVWPRCTFGSLNDGYFPFAQLDDNDNALDVL